jgi:hypothetical protein
MLGEGYCVEDLPDLVGTMPTLVLLSSDGNVGTTFAGPWLNIFANETVSYTSIVVHSMPVSTMSSTFIQTFRLEKMIVKPPHSLMGTSRRKFLWNVHKIPCNRGKMTSPLTKEYFATADGMLDLPGYLHVVDDDEGLLLTWFTMAGWHNADFSPCQRYQGPHPPQRRIVTAASHGWEQCWSDRHSGIEVKDSSTECLFLEPSIMIAFEARLDIYQVHAALEDRRLPIGTIDTSSQILYDLISLQNGGRIMELAVALKTEGKASVGLILSLDILTQHFVALQWVKWKPGSATQQNLNLFGCSWRMRQLQTGPYSVWGHQKKHPDDEEPVWYKASTWTHLCRETSLAVDTSLDQDAEVWSRFTVANAPKANAFQRKLRSQCPRLVSYSTLYPDTFPVDNHAVIMQLPIHSMRCQAPIELVYG